MRSAIAERIAGSAFSGLYDAMQAKTEDERQAQKPDAAESYQLLRAAAGGDSDALTKLASASVVAALAASGGADGVTTLAEGLSFARLAAVKSGSHQDRERVVAMLTLMSGMDTENALEWAAEAIAWLEQMADDGCEASAGLIACLGEGEHPDVLIRAAELKPHIASLWGQE